MDFIEDVLPLPEFPKRKISLASGDVVDYEYTPPGTPPTRLDEDYDLYVLYKKAERDTEKVAILRKRAKMDFLLSNCIEIGNGPIEFKSHEWEDRLEASLPKYKVPSHPGKKRLAFLKSCVITSKEEMDVIVQRCLLLEVDMQSIYSALRGFRLEMAR